MKQYDFTFTIAGLDEATEELANAIYDAGGDDSLVGSSDGMVFVDFMRQADSFDAAVESAMRVIQAAGYRIGEFRMDDHQIRDTFGALGGEKAAT